MAEIAVVGNILELRDVDAHLASGLAAETVSVCTHAQTHAHTHTHTHTHTHAHTHTHTHTHTHSESTP